MKTNIAQVIILTLMIISFSCKKQLSRPIDRNALLGVWSSIGWSIAPKKCEQSSLYDPTCIFYNFKTDGTFVTSKALKIDNKQSIDTCIIGKWEIISEGEYNVKFTFNNKTVSWDIFLNDNNSRLNVVEENCNSFNLELRKE